MTAISGETGSGETAVGLTVDFFLSRRGANAAVAQEVAGTLQDAGYTTFLQDYDIPRDGNFVLAMHEALKCCRHLVVLLTKDYDQSEFTRAEVSHFIAAAARADGGRRLVVLRVEDCVPEGLFAAHVFTDLVGVDDPQERRNRILAAAEGRAVASRARPRIFEHVPARDPNFTGRDQSLARLHDLLQGADAASSQVALHNFGGTGKTALATEYAHRHAASYSGIWWARAEGRTLLIASLAELAGRLDPSLAGEPDQEKAARAALARLARSAMPFLLVYDNVDTPETLRDLVPAVGARVLITSRWADWMGRAVEMKLDLFGKESAAEFLQKRAGRNDPVGRGGSPPRSATSRSRSTMPAPIAGSPDRASMPTARRPTPASPARRPAPPIRRASPPPSRSRSSRSWRRIRRPRRCSDVRFSRSNASRSI